MFNGKYLFKLSIRNVKNAICPNIEIAFKVAFRKRRVLLLDPQFVSDRRLKATEALPRAVSTSWSAVVYVWNFRKKLCFIHPPVKILRLNNVIFSIPTWRADGAGLIVVIYRKGILARDRIKSQHIRDTITAIKYYAVSERRAAIER